MRLTLTPTNGTAFVLGDDSQSTTIFAGTTVAAFANGLGGGIIEGSRPNTRWSLQKTPLFRAQNPFVAARFNIETVYTFTVDRNFQNSEMCGLFLDSHDSQIPVGGVMTITHYFGSAALALYRPLAWMQSADCVLHQQQHCQFRYSVLFNAPVTTISPI